MTGGPPDDGEALGEDVLRLIGRPQYVSGAGMPADRGHVRAMGAAVENANPTWWDDGAAEDLLGAAYCPATMLAAWGRPELWEPGRAEPLRALQAHFDLKDLLGFPASMAVSYTTSFHRPVASGDRLRTQQVLRRISDPKTTKMGRGRFWTIEMQYLDERSDLVGVESYEFFGFGKERA
ncbi:MaoC family dehydratase N-terminal domain-containing protein [Rhizorhabdus wittichii]|uniref:MaoC family dehydratase N-terminal domain-containing protein n=1 Tax=Rhizorhabdus wittichii TaxID=160791 RepID=A0A975HDI7_9SPHN|nr:MaoC family dehydratase N-terminal domain-containing protein [Rhizorhabdus wittichii]QTH21357.1 MaoC family dehydratase N-terminal domain-containing protein [Rhizorhabdus wittichii]